jgi:two-component system, LytTR family, response regulator
MRFRVLVVDDEPPARATAIRFLADDARFELVGEARDGIEAVEEIERVTPDLLVLDIQMPGRDGFGVLAAGPAAGLQRRMAVIFATAHADYAVPAFEADAIDYVCKPFARPRFARALDKAARALARPDRALVLRTVDGLVSVREHEVVQVSAAGKHVVVVTQTGRHVLRDTLGAVEARLSPDRFVRVHRSEIVNLAHVERLDGTTHGDGVLVLRNGSAVVLSRTCRARFLERFTASDR